MATRVAFFDEGADHSFEEEWPELARCLERFLAAKGVDPWLRADVVQETATRIYRRWSRLDRSRPLWNLVVTIALRILVDEHRKSSKVELVSDVSPLDVDDVETRAISRVHLTRTHSALKKLRAEQRRVLLAEIGEAAALEGNRNRINVLRLRARLALKSELGPWAPAGVAMRVRSLRAAIERRLAEWGQDAPGVTASMASVIVAATLVVTGAGIDGANASSLPQDPEVLALDELRDANFYSAVPSIKHPEPPNLSQTKGQAKKKAPEIRVCVGVCTSPGGKVGRTLNDAVKQADDAIREGDRQFRRGEKMVRRVVTDPPLP